MGYIEGQLEGRGEQFLCDPRVSNGWPFYKRRCLTICPIRKVFISGAFGIYHSIAQLQIPADSRANRTLDCTICQQPQRTCIPVPPHRRPLIVVYSERSSDPTDRIRVQMEGN